MTVSTNVYEKLGVFYMGREYDVSSGEVLPTPLLYDSKDLVTHAVIVGMTGSGKTGLGVSLLEEAAIDGIPSLVVDPKGDLTNLLLTFPDLSANDFAPWVSTDEARRQGKTREQFAEQQAQLWREGLAKWDQSGERIGRLRQTADFAIYTPGSDAGIPVSILSSFEPPPPEVMQESDLMRDRISTTATSLLALLGIDADPIRSREHILLTTLIDNAWRGGQPLDLGMLIQMVQNPPIQRVGVFDVESFYPSKERFELAMALNNLLASPGFSSWLTGEPLNVDRLLYTPEGKPRVAIFSIAHLSDSERMFFMSLLLNQTLGWMRSRPGTTSLRALLYIDEIFGYMPPVAEPPSKKPLLTLLKQARAYGLGLVLATQNPVDLDYKGLSNTGTWFLGRLQTERDKQRVLDGLEGATSESGESFDRRTISELLSGIGKRVFLLHNVHDDGPVTFQTRWALSYLSGPMTRRQIKQLTEQQKDAGQSTTTPSGKTGPATWPPRNIASTSPPVIGAADTVGAPAGAAPSAPPKPILPPDVSEVYLPISRPTGGGEIVYCPRLVGLAKVHFVDTRTGLSAEDDVALLTSFEDDAVGVEWSDAVQIGLTSDDLFTDPPQPGSYDELPSIASQAKKYTTWKKSLENYLYRHQRYSLFRSVNLGVVSSAGESERDFRIRLSDSAREERDSRIEELRKKYASKFDRVKERIRKAELRVDRERQEAQGAKLQTAISFGATLLSAVMGRKRFSSTTVSRATTAARGVGRASKQADDVRRAQEDVEAYGEKLQELEDELAEEVEKIEERCDPLREELETLLLKPRKTDINVRLVALAWMPFGRDAHGALIPLFGE